MGLGQPRIHLDRCGSTNDELAARAAGAATGTAVIADRQDAGRGRGAHLWHSPPGNLYASILLRPAVAPAVVPAISLVAGIAVARALRQYGVEARLKWPNDVVVGDRKIAGVLSESASRGGAVDHVIAGVGVNLATRDFPPELAATATSVAVITGHAPEPGEVLDAICAELGDPLARFVAGGVPAIRADWEALWRDRGRRARVDVGEGVAIGITDAGHLELELDGGARVTALAGPVEMI